MQIRVTVDMPAPPLRVWERLERIEDHVDWMADAARIDFVSVQRRGVGTKISVATRIGPLRTADEMTFVQWDPPSVMAVEHRGLFKGSGRFTLEPMSGDATRFTWEEVVHFPWFLGGAAGARLAQPVLRRVWRGNLRRLRDQLSPR